MIRIHAQIDTPTWLFRKILSHVGISHLGVPLQSKYYLGGDPPRDQVIQINYTHPDKNTSQARVNDIYPPPPLPGRIWHKIILMWEPRTNWDSCRADAKYAWSPWDSSLGAPLAPSNELNLAEARIAWRHQAIQINDTHTASTPGRTVLLMCLKFFNI